MHGQMNGPLGPWTVLMCQEELSLVVGAGAVDSGYLVFIFSKPHRPPGTITSSPA
jgi:hypothetical protein